MLNVATYFNGRYDRYKELLLSDLENNFEIEGTIHFGANGLINIDGSFSYKGDANKDLSKFRFGVIRGHASFSRILIKELVKPTSKPPSIEFANLITFLYKEETGLLSLLRFPPNGGLFLDGVFRLGKCTVPSEALKIIYKYQGEHHQNGRDLKATSLDAHEELSDKGYEKYAYF